MKTNSVLDKDGNTPLYRAVLDGDIINMDWIWIPALPASANNMKIWSPKQHRFFPNPKYKAAKERIQFLVLEKWNENNVGMIFSETVSLTVVFDLRNVEKTWDIDNHLKAVQDALKGIAYDDDTLVKNLSVRIDMIPKWAVEGFWFNVYPYKVQIAKAPHEKTKILTEKPAPKPKQSKSTMPIMSVDEFKRRFGK